MGKVSVSLAYSAELIASLSITLSVGTITISFLWSFEHMVNGYLDGDNNCVLAEPIYLLVTTAIYDIGFGVLLLCLFIKKLHSTHRDRSRLREVQHLITKNTALIVITYGCSAVLGAVSLFFFYPKGININSFDLVVNVVCVSLMKKRWDTCYRCCCRLPDTCINALILSCIAHVLRALSDISPIMSNPSRPSPEEIVMQAASTAPSQPPLVSQDDELESKNDGSGVYPVGISSITITAEANLMPIDEASSMPTSSMKLQLEPINEQTPQSSRDKQFYDTFGCTFAEAVERTMAEDSNTNDTEPEIK